MVYFHTKVGKDQAEKSDRALGKMPLKWSTMSMTGTYNGPSILPSKGP